MRHALRASKNQERRDRHATRHASNVNLAEKGEQEERDMFLQQEVQVRPANGFGPIWICEIFCLRNLGVSSQFWFWLLRTCMTRARKLVESLKLDVKM